MVELAAAAFHKHLSDGRNSLISYCHGRARREPSLRLQCSLGIAESTWARWDPDCDGGGDCARCVCFRIDTGADPLARGLEDPSGVAEADEEADFGGTFVA